MAFSRDRDIARGRRAPLANDMRVVSQAMQEDIDALDALIDQEGVRDDTRRFLESVKDGCAQWKRPMTEKQRAAVDRVRERLDDKGWA